MAHSSLAPGHHDFHFVGNDTLLWYRDFSTDGQSCVFLDLGKSVPRKSGVPTGKESYAPKWEACNRLTRASISADSQ